MSKMLQTNARPDRTPRPPVRATTLILDNSYTDKVIEFIRDAHSEIRVTAYAWRWYDSEPEIGIQKLNQELLRATLRGVTVRILCDTIQTMDSFRAYGFDVRSVVNTRMMHSKVVVIDQKTIVIGSHNLTKRANTDNYETSVALQDHEVIAQFTEYFDRLWVTRG